MKESETHSRLDRPLNSSEDDLLDRSGFTQTLVDILVEKKEIDGQVTDKWKSTDFVVGLAGQWGQGKSSVLHFVKNELESEKYKNVVVMLFNPWLYRGKNDLISGFFNKLRASLNDRFPGKSNQLRSLLGKYQRSLQLVLDISPVFLSNIPGGNIVGNLLTSIYNVFSSKYTGEINPDDYREQIEIELAENGISLVVLIDELDRIEDEEIRAIAQLVKAVGEIKGISYLVAYDPERVIQALGGKSSESEGNSNSSSSNDRGELNLSKIIQHQIPLRLLVGDEKQKFLNEMFSTFGINFPLPETKREKKIIEIIIDKINSPREIKRLVGTFSIYNRVVSNEFCKFDLLGFCWLISIFPTIYDILKEHIDMLVENAFDLEESYSPKTSSGEQNRFSVYDLLFNKGNLHYIRCKELIDLLFTPVDNLEFHDHRLGLFHHENLTRLLYLGNPPGMIDRRSLEESVKITDSDSLKNFFYELKSKNVLHTLPNRLPDFKDICELINDEIYWIGLSKIIYENSNSDIFYKKLAREVIELMNFIVSNSQNGKQRFIKIIDHLIEQKDLVLISSFISYELIASGLTSIDNSQYANGILDKDYLEKTADIMIPRIKSAILDGTFLNHLPLDAPARFLIAMNMWDKECKEALTSQLTDVSSLEKFLILFPHIKARGYRVELEQYVDVFKLEEQIEKISSLTLSASQRQNIGALKTALKNAE